MIKLTYPLAMDRVKTYITPSDLKEALRLFREQTHVDAQLVEVAEKTAKVLEGVLPEGLELQVHGGVAGWDIWLSSPHWDGKENFNPLPTQNRENPPVTDVLLPPASIEQGAIPVTAPSKVFSSRVSIVTSQKSILVRQKGNKATKSVTKPENVTEKGNLKVLKEMPPVQKQKDLFGRVLLKERIKEMAGAGSYRRITEKLKSEGYEVSYGTVARRLQDKLI